jgi:endonuclease/exonuclease/phosphatase family metal-dependent hydrolase
LLALLGYLVLLAGCLQPTSSTGAPADTPKTYLFCFWNTENFFDDQPTRESSREPDKTFDNWFSSKPEVVKQKVKNMTEVLMELNEGKGPDILALAEVETERSAELLRDSMNAHLRNPALHYKTILWKDPHGGRNISTVIITRVPVVQAKTQLIGRRQRILEGHLEVNGHDLVILATHWTSRVSDELGHGRKAYADLVYGRYRAMAMSNPKVDFLVCGDFNDNPEDPSVKENLHAVADPALVRIGGDPPMLLDLFGKAHEEGKGTHFYRGKAFVFDHIVVSPGLLDNEGWHCDVASAKIVSHRFMDKKGHPYHFGTERERTPLTSRGVSDHLPVTVRLKVAGG